jgi:reverse gyrase
VVRLISFTKGERMTNNRGVGRPRVYAHDTLIRSGVALSVEQRKKLAAFAAANGTTVCAVLRGLVEQWVATQGTR